MNKAKIFYNLKNKVTGEQFKNITAAGVYEICGLEQKNFYRYIEEGRVLGKQWVLEYAKITDTESTNKFPQQLLEDWDNVVGMFRRVVWVCQ